MRPVDARLTLGAMKVHGNFPAGYPSATARIHSGVRSRESRLRNPRGALLGRPGMLPPRRGPEKGNRRITGRRGRPLAGLVGVVEPLDAQDLAVAQRPQMLLVDLYLGAAVRPRAQKTVCQSTLSSPRSSTSPSTRVWDSKDSSQVLHHLLHPVGARAGCRGGRRSPGSPTRTRDRAARAPRPGPVRPRPRTSARAGARCHFANAATAGLFPPRPRR